MYTIYLTLLLLALMFWLGAGPILLLLPQSNSGRRVLLLPFAGLCACILLGVILAQFDFTGYRISIWALILFSGLACYGLYRSPLSRKELRASSAPLLLGLLSLVFIAWPLFRAGFEHYWGYANPDQAYLIQVLNWTYHHPYGPPPGSRIQPLNFRGVEENTLLPMFYLISTAATLTRTLPDLLYNVAEASLIPLVPISVFLFAETLGLTRRAALLVSACVACSSLVAYTFYLDSLGALSVIAVVPASLALLLTFGKTGSIRYAALVSGTCAAMYYNYLGSVGVLAVLMGAVALYLLISRQLPVSRLLLPGALTAALIALPWAGLAASILRAFIFETFTGRLVPLGAVSPDAELLNSFALSFTEQGVPFFWGLKLHGSQLVPWQFAAGLMCFVVLGFSVWPRISRLSRAFPYVLVAALLPVVVYAFKGSGYGVFKLAAWMSPFMITGLIAALLGLADFLRRHHLQRLAFVPYLGIAAYAGINAVLAFQLATFTQSAAMAGTQQNEINIPAANIRQLRSLDARLYRNNIAVMPGDGVTQQWATAYLPASTGRPFPDLRIVPDDSTPILKIEPLPEAYVLHMNDPRLDIVEPILAPSVWSNTSFALSRLDQLSNALFTGYGWYRVESVDLAAAYWQRHFRWVRKRAELLLVNPLPRPQRLLVTMVVGYGNPSPARHVAFLLNGQLFDEVKVVGYARILTKPFKALPPWSQIELVVREDTEPLPRSHPLWAPWVPKESRRLNIAVSEAGLVDASGTGPCASSFNVAEEFEKAPHALLNGIWPDRWIGSEANLLLCWPQDARQLEVTGVLPPAAGLALPYVIGLEINDRPLGKIVIPRFGKFRTAVPLSDMQPGGAAGQAVRLTLKPAATFHGKDGDTRALSVRLEGVRFTNYGMDDKNIMQ